MSRNEHGAAGERVSTRRRIVAVPILIGLGWLGAIGGALARVSLDDPTPSRSTGTPGDGHLEHGHAMPPTGAGYMTYSYVGAALGRQYVHGAVRDLLLETFQACAKARPDRTFVLGETGWRDGGRLWPHKSHENGLSVDVFMPMRDSAGRAKSLPTWPWNKLGYGIDLDDAGRLGELRVDFDDLALLLVELGARAPAFGLYVQQIIVAPEFVPLLLATPTGKTMGKLTGALLRRAAWWRHDEHVHIDFGVAGPHAAPRAG